MTYEEAIDKIKWTPLMRLENEHGELKEALQMAIEALEKQNEKIEALQMATDASEIVSDGNQEKEEDRVFLLSIEEYEMYMDDIPHINTWWWLRSPGDYSDCAAGVRSDGSVNYCGDYVNIATDCVRPALRYATLKSEISKSKDENCFIWNEIKWKIIDKEKEIAIAYMPIAFDKFDDNSNDYESSHIRKWLLDWSK